jgi:hypothetical protein
VKAGQRTNGIARYGSAVQMNAQQRAWVHSIAPASCHTAVELCSQARPGQVTVAAMPSFHVGPTARQNGRSSRSVVGERHNTVGCCGTARRFDSRGVGDNSTAVRRGEWQRQLKLSHGVRPATGEGI